MVLPMLTAHDLMTRNPVSIQDTESLRVAVEVLATLDIRHLPVVDSSGELVGMLSDRDLRGLTPVADADATTRVLASKVSSVMSDGVLAVDEEADAAEVIDLMIDNKVGALPVTDDSGSLVGIVSYVDVLRALSTHD
jgi:acetoin utilization protein AcuB